MTTGSDTTGRSAYSTQAFASHHVMHGAVLTHEILNPGESLIRSWVMRRSLGVSVPVFAAACGGGDGAANHDPQTTIIPTSDLTRMLA